MPIAITVVSSSSCGTLALLDRYLGTAISISRTTSLIHPLVVHHHAPTIIAIIVDRILIHRRYLLIYSHRIIIVTTSSSILTNLVPSSQ